MLKASYVKDLMTIAVFIKKSESKDKNIIHPEFPFAKNEYIIAIGNLLLANLKMQSKSTLRKLAIIST